MYLISPTKQSHTGLHLTGRAEANASRPSDACVAGCSAVTPSALPGQPDIYISQPSASARPSPSGTHLPGPSGIHLPGPSGINLPGPSGIHPPGPSGIHLPGPSGVPLPGPSGVHLPGPSGVPLSVVPDTSVGESAVKGVV